VSESTRSRVLAAAHQLGYRADSSARGLRSGRVRAVGVVVGPDAASMPTTLGSPFISHYVLSLVDELSRAGIPVFRIGLAEMSNLSHTPIDALHIVSLDPSIVLPDSVTRGLPLIMTGGPRKGIDAATIVGHDHDRMTRQILAHFDVQGARRPALLARTGSHTYVHAARAVYERACLSNGQEPVVLETDGNPAHVERTVAAAIKTHRIDAMYSTVGEPGAIVAAAQRCRLSIPADFMIATMSDGRAEALMTPAVTVQALQASEAAASVANAISNGMSNGTWPARVVLAHLLIPRQSTNRTASTRPELGVP